MDRYIEEFDEVLRIRRDNRKVMIECIPPENVVCSSVDYAFIESHGSPSAADRKREIR